MPRFYHDDISDSFAFAHVSTMGAEDARMARDHAYGDPADYPEELGNADQAVSEALSSLRMLSHDEWEYAIQRAREQNWRQEDIDLLRGAQIVAALGGPKYHDPGRIVPGYGMRGNIPNPKFRAWDEPPRYRGFDENGRPI